MYVFKGELQSGSHSLHTILFSYKILYVSLLITDYLIKLAFWVIYIGL